MKILAGAAVNIKMKLKWPTGQLPVNDLRLFGTIYALSGKVNHTHMKKIAFTATLLAFSLWGWAQNATDTLANGIRVTKDARLDLLIKKQYEINDRANKLKDNKGYRIMVVNTSNRDEALKAKSTLLQNFPEQKPYLAYQPPYFKLKFGDFKTREEAVDYQKKLKPYFPKGGLFIVPDRIEIKLDEKEKQTDNSQ